MNTPVDGVLRKMPHARNSAVVAFILSNHDSRVQHVWGVSFSVWNFKSEDDFNWLQATFEELKAQSSASQESERIPLANLRSPRPDDCYMVWRRDMYFRPDNKIWNSNVLCGTQQKPGKSLEYSFEKIGGMDLQLALSSRVERDNFQDLSPLPTTDLSEITPFFDSDATPVTHSYDDTAVNP